MTKTSPIVTNNIRNSIGEEIQNAKMAFKSKRKKTNELA